ncbi:hypothetical protein ACVWYN_002421 [Pedobacter sp. UYP24]
MQFLLSYFLIIDWLKGHLLTCPFKSHTGLDCPGCGFQRSLLALIQGDVKSSIHLFPASLPIVMLLIFVPAHLKFDFKQGARTIKLLYLFIALVIVLNYVYKIYNHNLY